MPFVKKVRKKTKKGYRTYFYLARNYREGPKVKQEILRSLTPEEAHNLQQGISSVSSSGETISSSSLELEQLRIENTLLLQISQQFETEHYELTQKNAQLAQDLAKAKAPLIKQDREPSASLEQMDHHRTKRKTPKKRKRQPQKLTLQQFLSS
ncbi:MAG: hypothetical protein ACFFGZ_07420 [Candidatus Thorarchaeota archaeon]